MSTFYKDSSDNRYYVGRAFTYSGTQYTKAGATASTFLGLGFTAVTVGLRPDDRFYIVTGPDANGAYTTTDRDLAELKTRFVRETKLAAIQFLKNTDWYVVRNIENSTAIPTEVTTYRAALRTASSTRCDEINAVTTVAALETLIGGTGLTDWPARTDVEPFEFGGY